MRMGSASSYGDLGPTTKGSGFTGRGTGKASSSTRLATNRQSSRGTSCTARYKRAILIQETAVSKATMMIYRIIKAALHKLVRAAAQPITLQLPVGSGRQWSSPPAPPPVRCNMRHIAGALVEQRDYQCPHARFPSCSSGLVERRVTVRNAMAA